MRFEVRLNGELVCRAGASGDCRYLCAEVARSVKRTKRGRLESSCKFGVAASTNADFLRDQRLVWLLEDVTVGDEIRFRLVEHGDITKPMDPTLMPEFHAPKIVEFPARKGR